MILLASHASAAPLVRVKDLASGIDDATGAKLPATVHDTEWRWDGPTSTLYLFAADQDRIPSGFLADDASPHSRWLVYEAASDGTYTFEQRVDLTGFDPATARIEGLRVASDNWIASIAVNGTPVFDQAPPAETGAEFEAFRDLGVLGEGTFVDAVNVISIAVVNDPWSTETNPVAVRVEGAVVAAPASLPVSTFQGLGDLPGGESYSEAMNLAADGSTVVGLSGSSLGWYQEGFRWNEDSGIVGMGCIPGFCGSSQPDPPSDGPLFLFVGAATHVSADGRIIAGHTRRPDSSACPFTSYEGAMYTWTEADGLATQDTGPNGRITAFATDASTLTGRTGTYPYGGNCAVFFQLLGWIDRGNGPTAIPEQPGHEVYFGPVAMSADGSRVVGNIHDPYDTGRATAALWDDDGEILPIGDPIPFTASGASPDARIVVGHSYPTDLPVVWSEALGTRVLALPDGFPNGEALAATFDGRIVLGRVWADERPPSPPLGLLSLTDGVPMPDLWIWLDEGEPLLLADWFEHEWGLDLGSWQLTHVAGISNDGRTIAGTGREDGVVWEAWVARLALPVPEPAGLPAGAAALATLASLLATRRRRPVRPGG